RATSAKGARNFAKLFRSLRLLRWYCPAVASAPFKGKQMFEPSLLRFAAIVLPLTAAAAFGYALGNQRGQASGARPLEEALEHSMAIMTEQRAQLERLGYPAPTPDPDL